MGDLKFYQSSLSYNLQHAVVIIDLLRFRRQGWFVASIKRGADGRQALLLAANARDANEVKVEV